MNIVKFLSRVQVEPVLFLYMIITSLSNPNEEGILFRKVCLTHYERDFCNEYFANSSNMLNIKLEITGNNETIESLATNSKQIFQRDIDLLSDVREFDFKSDTFHHLFKHKKHGIKAKEDLIQTEASKWVMYTNIAVSVPSIFTTSILGAWSDTVSRKYPIIIALLGLLLSNIFYLAIAHNLNDWPLYTFLIPSFLFGLCGASNTLISSIFSYVSHLSDVHERTIRLAFLESLVMIGGSLGLFLSGIISDRYGFYISFLVVTFLNLLTLLYSIVYVDDLSVTGDEESFDESLLEKPTVKSKFKDFCKKFFTCAYIKDTLNVLFTARPNRANLYIYLSIGAFLASVFVSIGEGSISYLYLRKSPISFTQTEYGYYRSARTFLLGFSLLAILPFLKRLVNISDMTCIIIGTISRCCVDFLYVFSTKRIVVYIIPFAGMFTSYIIIALRSFLSKLVKPYEEGKLFSIIGTLEMLDFLFSAFAFNYLYTWSLNYFAGLVFAISLLIHSFTIPIYLFIKMDSKKQRENLKLLQETDNET